MCSTSIDDFLLFELDPQMRLDLLNAIESLTSGRREVTYNAFNVSLDANTGEASIYDVLDAERSTTIPLETFGRLLRSWSDKKGRAN